MAGGAICVVSRFRAGRCSAQTATCGSQSIIVEVYPSAASMIGFCAAGYAALDYAPISTVNLCLAGFSSTDLLQQPSIVARDLPRDDGRVRNGLETKTGREFFFWNCRSVYRGTIVGQMGILGVLDQYNTPVCCLYLYVSFNLIRSGPPPGMGVLAIRDQVYARYRLGRDFRDGRLARLVSSSLAGGTVILRVCDNSKGCWRWSIWRGIGTDWLLFRFDSEKQNLFSKDGWWRSHVAGTLVARHAFTSNGSRRDGRCPAHAMGFSPRTVWKDFSTRSRDGKDENNHLSTSGHGGQTS